MSNLIFIKKQKGDLPMNGTVKFSDLPREEQIDYCVQQLSGHEKEPEIVGILAILVTFTMSNEVYMKYGFSDYDTDELLDLFPRLLCGDYAEEERAWNAILDTLDPCTICDILQNPIPFIDKYLKVKKLVDDVKHNLFKSFALRILHGGGVSGNSIREDHRQA